MNDAEAKQLIDRYSVSWYADIDRIPPERICPRDRIPAVPTGEDLIHAMESNVFDAREHLRGVVDRRDRADRDGLFDVEALKASGKETRKLWAAAIEVVLGDHVRAASELKHWREYHSWALSKREIAPAPAGAVDPRLPPERDDDAEAPL